MVAGSFAAFSSEHNVPFQVIAPGASHVIVTDTVSKTSANFASTTTLIMVHAVEDSWILIGASPVAKKTVDDDLGASFFIPSGQTHFFGIKRTDGDTKRLAALQDIQSGRIIICEGSA